MTERDRLIELIHKAGDVAQNAPIIDFTATLADYLLDNGVIVPPVKVGDTVYYICEELPEFGGNYISELSISKVSDKRFWVEHEDNNHFQYADIGKNVFLSCEEAEEAEEALEKLENGDTP